MITFTLYVSTEWGQTLFLCFPDSHSSPIEMTCLSDGKWQVSVERVCFKDTSRYYYVKCRGDKWCEEDPVKSRSLPMGSPRENVPFMSVCDSWNGALPPSYVYSSAFKKSFYFHDKSTIRSQQWNDKVLFRITSFFLPSNQTILLCGSDATLGTWHLPDAPGFSSVGYGEWWLLRDKEELSSNLEYKYVIVDKDTREAIYWQRGDNRSWRKEESRSFHVENVDTSDFFKAFRTSGVVVPTFSIRTQHDCGIGDFLSLRKMVDWASDMGMRVIQILPINDTSATHTWRDSYPYNAISVYALHPIYLGVTEYPLKDRKKYRRYMADFARLNALQHIDYESVIKIKNTYVSDLFEELFPEIKDNADYQIFIASNQEWLFPYACFCTLKDKYETTNFSLWQEFAHYHQEKLRLWTQADNEVSKQINKVYFVQYLLDKQLKETSQYARSKGVILKGDIPIGINPHSVDAWMYPSLFNMEAQAGAPPDDFAVLGQNWRFPTYNWEAMAGDGYAWWRSRFRKMADFFDAYRIDHILGFFRIWEIPSTAIHALLGCFTPAMPLSITEIESFGYTFDEERDTTAQMPHEDVQNHFGEHTRWAIEQFLTPAATGYLKLKPHVDTQKKILDYFSSSDTEQEENMKNLLLLFADEVLFVQDSSQKTHYHPRIQVASTRRFAHLDFSQQQSLLAMYDHFYYHRHNSFWKEKAEEKLIPLLHSTEMLPCGEDLGMIPACVEEVMRNLQILSLDIERMPKTAQEAFEPLDKLPFLSVCATSTHDMSPLRLWWKENPVLTQKYWNQVLWQEGKAPEECPVEQCEQILRNHLNSSAMLAVFPIQDWMSIDAQWRSRPAEEERINIPSVPDFYWKYRMHISVEELQKYEQTSGKIKQLLFDTQRV